MTKLFRINLVVFFLTSTKIFSQEFYVNILNTNPPYNNVQKLDVLNQNQSPISFCSPSVNTTDVYTDIAIDSSNNMYYVSQVGELYKRDNSTSNCSYLGHFSTIPNFYYGTNSLVSDMGNYLYAIVDDRNLFRYDINTGVFSKLGMLPDSQKSAGDLFFHENKLFLLTLTGILEINMANPSQSCYFMDIDLPNLYAGFSINYGTNSKTYVFSYNFSTKNSQMYEVDMANKTIGEPIRIYNSMIQGAASVYELTSTNSVCTPNLSTQEATTKEEYLNIVNPVKNNIICRTNIDRNQITSVRLYDNSGKLVKDFSNQKNIENLSISGISSGVYLLTLSTNNGKTFTKRIIVEI